MNPQLVLFLSLALEHGINYMTLSSVLGTAVEVDKDIHAHYSEYVDFINQRYGGLPELTTGRDR